MTYNMSSGTLSLYSPPLGMHVMWTIAINDSGICLFVMQLCCAKMAECIEVQVGVKIFEGPENAVLDWTCTVRERRPLYSTGLADQISILSVLEIHGDPRHIKFYGVLIPAC